MKGLIAVLVVLLAIGVLFFYSSGPPSAPAEMSEAEIAQVEAEVAQTISDRWAAYHDVLVAGDIPGIQDYWTSDLRVLEPGMDFTKNDVENFFTDFFGSGGVGYGFQPETFDVFVHGDVAYHVGQYDEDVQFGGQERNVIQNYFFARWEKGEDGVWRISRFVAAPREAPPTG
jgi:ketosteroid isomerase-like protein